MSLEKLFVQIFERKDWIIEQAQQQADAYYEQLASRLLIDEITPPPCLLNQRCNSRSSNHHELKKEEIISKLLLQQHPRDSVRYSTGGPFLYERPVVSRGNGHQLPTEVSHAPNKGVNVTLNDDIGCSLNRVNEQDDSVNSPQHEMDARISSIYAASSTSLARIQRSKSRQKALELRTSAKTAAKSCLGDENRTRISFTGDQVSKSDFHQDKFPSEPGICNDISGVAAEGKGRLDKHSILNDHSKSNDKEELDGGQQSGHAVGVNLLDISLGAKKCKTHDTQRQSKPYSTRSRGSSQQTGGVKVNKSASYNPKEGLGGLCYSIGDLKHGNKLLDAVETSQVCSEVICSSKDVKKSVISSNIASASRVTSSMSGSMKEDGEIVVGLGPIDAVNSVKKMCMESDGLALKQSSECCILVKPKQLNFDEMDGCDSNKVRKRSLDGLLGHECNPSMDSASSLKDYESSGEQKSSQSKSARTHSHEDFIECGNDETMDIDLDMNENPMVEKRKPDGLLGEECNPSMDYSASSVDHKSSGEQQLPMENVKSSQSKAERTNSHDECEKDEMMNIDENPKVSLHDDDDDDDVAALCEVDVHNENAAGDFIPVSSLTKQGDKDSEDSSKSTELEVETNSKLPNWKLNSATWPRDPHRRNVDDQRKCFSDSQGFRAHAAIHCDLEASENDFHISQSQSDDIIQSFDNRVHDEMMFGFLERKNSLHELQATKPTVTDDTLEQSRPSLIKSAADDMAADVAAVDQTNNDETMPEYEGFTIDEEELQNAEGVGIDFNKLEMPSSTIERASLLEQICKSATMNTPFSKFSSTFKQHQVQALYKFMPDGILDEEDFRNHFPTHQQTFDSLPFSGTPFNWESKNYHSSPVGKLWDRSASSSNPEHTCFPIEEDPNSNEESENDELQQNITLKAENEEKIPTTEMEIVPMKYRDRCSSNSVNIQVNNPRTHDNKSKYKSKFHPGVSRTPSISTRASIRRNASLQTQNSKNMKSGIKKPTQKRNNIVSNIKSFVSIVQQKQVAAVCPGKRDIKVKALEAAEAAKRREEEKENERRMKKEALRIERARVEKENAREMELNKKRKHEEMKKKEADVAARKKQREEDERKQVAKKRKIAETRKEQKAQHIAIACGSKKGSQNVKQNKNAFNEKDKETKILEKSPGNVGLVRLTSQENSYDISPYQCSDDEDEDEDEDELPTKKFIPSWASKRAVAMVLPLQQELDPETIFPAGSFCDMDEVLLPRRLQAQ